jgi:multidrug efflux system outer membrane protein
MEDEKGEYAMKKRLMIGSLIVSLLAGCAVGPKYRRPIVEPPSVFRGTADPAAAPDPNSLVDLKWYEVFKNELLALVQLYKALGGGWQQ